MGCFSDSLRFCDAEKNPYFWPISVDLIACSALGDACRSTAFAMEDGDRDGAPDEVIE
jgi:hypothetical protein